MLQRRRCVWKLFDYFIAKSSSDAPTLEIANPAENQDAFQSEESSRDQGGDRAGTSDRCGQIVALARENKEWVS